MFVRPAPWAQRNDPLDIGYPSSGIPSTASVQTAWGTASRAIYQRLISGGLVSSMKWQMTVSSGNYDIGIYSCSPSGGFFPPSSRVFSIGTTAMPAAGEITVTVSPPRSVSPSLNYFAFVVDNTTATPYNWPGGTTQTLPLQSWMYFESAAIPLPLTATPTVGSSRCPMIVGR